LAREWCELDIALGKETSLLGQRRFPNVAWQHGNRPGQNMRVGVIFPQTEIGSDAGAIRAYCEQVEQLGFSHLAVYDHILGADPDVHTGWTGPYDVDTPFHEPFVLLGFVAAFTSRLELVTGVIVLPQRQTALVAKQAAEVDLLSSGRLTLGVGLGWNAVEYEGLGQDFTTRGRRLDEQIVLLRRLWTERTVTHEGTFDRVTGAGLAPAPIQRPIPIWLGARSPAAYRRVGHLADGWFPRVSPGPKLEEALSTITISAREAGRDPSSIGMDARISWTRNLDELEDRVRLWRELGATRVSIDTMGADMETVDDHLDALESVKPALDAV
jgi:probable F420-dependent oxidoreductase